MFHGSADSVFVMNNKKIKIVFVRERIKPAVRDYQSRRRGYAVRSLAPCKSKGKKPYTKMPMNVAKRRKV